MVQRTWVVVAGILLAVAFEVSCKFPKSILNDVTGSAKLWPSYCLETYRQLAQHNVVG